VALATGRIKPPGNRNKNTKDLDPSFHQVREDRESVETVLCKVRLHKIYFDIRNQSCAGVRRRQSMEWYPEMSLHD
jgi:hypothetical protein